MANPKAYIVTEWLPRKTPISAIYLNKIEEHLATLSGVLYPDISLSEDRILIIRKNEQEPSWINIVSFMNSALADGYRYDGNLEN